MTNDIQAGTIIGWAISAWLTIMALPPSIAAFRAAGEGDSEGMIARIVRAVNWSALLLGVPTAFLAAFSLWIYAEAHPSGGMMAPSVGVFLLAFILGILVLAAWVGMLLLGTLGGLIAKNLPSLLAGFVVYLFCSGGAPAFFALAMAGQALGLGGR